ncbi:MAG: hypothetical protein HYU25_15150 [Candidatus Rokubacteria bacterium]|nr:hypothetical protein [Candidatus Rokubacteria bacterium]
MANDENRELVSNTWAALARGDVKSVASRIAFKLASASGEPNNLCLFFEWQSVAKKFLAMERAGVAEKPEIYIAEELATGKP